MVYVKDITYRKCVTIILRHRPYSRCICTSGPTRTVSIATYYRYYVIEAWLNPTTSYDCHEKPGHGFIGYSEYEKRSSSAICTGMCACKHVIICDAIDGGAANHSGLYWIDITAHRASRLHLKSTLWPGFNA